MRSFCHQSLSRFSLGKGNPFPRFIPLMPAIAQKIRIGYALVLLSAAVPLWLVTEAIAPPIVQAYTARTDLLIDRLPEDNYESLLRRAEAAARAAAQRSFDADILVSDVSVFVCVQNYGAIAPVLELAVSRQQWRTRPDPQRWAKYFKSARSLLYFGDNFKTPIATQATTTPLPALEPQPANVPQTKPDLSPPPQRR